MDEDARHIKRQNRWVFWSLVAGHAVIIGWFLIGSLWRWPDA